MKSVVWAVFQYGVEGWTLNKSDRNRIEAFEMWCWRKMLSISWQEHHTNNSILTELGLEREFMGRVAKPKLQYFGHITRGSAGQLESWKGCSIKADREDSGYTTLKNGLAANTFS